MPVSKSDIPQQLLAGVKTLFFEAYESTQAQIYERVCTIVPSTKSVEPFGWLGSVPSMRQFTDERVPAGLLEHDYSLTNRTYEASVAVKRDAIEDEQYGQLQVRIRDMAAEAKRHTDQLVVELLSGGFAADCYDGQYFFDTDHAESGTDQSNKGTAALSLTSLKDAIVAMMKFTDDKGKPMGVIPDLLVIPPDLWATAAEILLSTSRPDESTGAINPINALSRLGMGKLDLLVSPYLTDADNWYLLATNRPVKPLILTQRTSVEFDSLESDSEAGFMRDEYVYGIRERKAGGYGMWHFAYGADVS